VADDPDLPELLMFALSLAGVADEAALGGFRRDLRIAAKPDRTLVTHVDEAIEAALRERIRGAYPSHGLVGEEYGVEAGDAPTRWYIDPIDGTHNFVRGVPLFGTLLALEHLGEVVLGVMSAPALGERWYATRGSGAWAVRGEAPPRRLRVSAVGRIEDAQLLYGSGFEIERSGRAPGFAALRGAVWRERGFGDFWGYALIAEGAGEGMVEFGPRSWDLAAPFVIVEEAGGRLTDFDGRRRIDGGEVLASNGLLHDELLARLRGAASSGPTASGAASSGAGASGPTASGASASGPGASGAARSGSSTS
jgi:histidinol-phosphatase